MNTYNRLPVTFTHGSGVYLYDTKGQAYLDGLAGIAVNGVGHAHPVLVKAIAEQAGRMIHCSNLYQIEAQEQLAKKLVAITGMTNAFICNSGCEANEAAIKLARLHGHQKGFQNPSIMVFENAFHGRTMATLSATGNSKVQKGFAPLVRGFLRVPFNDIEAVKNALDANPETTAILLEPLQGEGGIIEAHPQFLRDLRRLCTERDMLLMLDEVQCGMGRTGQWSYFHHLNAEIDKSCELFLPDVLTLAKGLGGGVPIGACLAANKAATLFQAGHHGSTFGGNPLACAAALANLSIIENEGLIDNARRMGDLLKTSLEKKLAELPHSQAFSVRGRGLMIGVDWPMPLPSLALEALTQQLLINVTHEKVIRLLPALIFKAEHVALLVDRLYHSLLADYAKAKTA